MNTQQLYYILDHTPAHQNVMLTGRHGIGKSEILRTYYAARGMRVVALFLGQMADPGDLIGLPSQKGDSMQFLPPYWWPMDGKPIVLFLDELNRARPELLQTVMDLCLNRCLAGRSLPEGSRVIAAINEGDDYQLTPLDPALKSRFNIYAFSPTVDEWLRWAETKGLDERVVRFIEGDPGQLIDRRAWTRLAEVVADIPVLTENDAPLLCGIVGTAAASRFLAAQTGYSILSAKQVLSDFSAHEAEIRSYRLHQLATLNESVFRLLDTTETEPEYSANMKAYVQLLHDNEEREAMAHMANLFASGTYAGAVRYLSTDCVEVYHMLIDCVASL